MTGNIWVHLLLSSVLLQDYFRLSGRTIATFSPAGRRPSLFLQLCFLVASSLSVCLLHVQVPGGLLAGFGRAAQLAGRTT